MKNKWTVALTAILVVCGLSVPAWAQDGSSPGTKAKAKAAGAPSAKEEAIARVPTYEETGVAETPQEAFLRLAEDTIFVSEVGVRTPGSVPIWPRGAFKAGPVLLFPYLVGKISWTDNVFLQQEDRSSWFVTEGAGFTGQYSFLGGRAAVNFGADYQHRDYMNRDLSYSEWVAGIGATYRFPTGVWARAGVKWERLVDPIGIEYRGKLRRDQFYPYFDVGLDNVLGNKINVQAGVTYLDADFESEEFASGDREEWEAYLKVSYPVFKETTRVYLRYDYLWADRKDETLNDLDQGQRLSVGLEGAIPLTRTEKLLGFVQVGVRQDSYGSQRVVRLSSTTTGTTDGDDNESTISVMAGLRYLMGPKTSVNLEVLRDLQFSTRANYQVLTRGDLAVTHNVLRNLVARAAAFFEQADPSGGGTVTGSTYTFTRFGFGLGARYILIENVDIDLALDWHKRNTSLEGFDYDAFLGSLGVTFYFR